jgi:3-hydroxy-3-methylglutaryl CoA synthase
VSIVKFGGFYIPTCDLCGAELQSEDDFYDAVSAKKAAGWKSRMVNGWWEDWCDECWGDDK